MIANLAVTEGFLNWERLGKCVLDRIDPEVFFPEIDGRGRWASQMLRWRVTEAVAICMQCPVRKPCRDKAREVHADCGVWGGEFLGATRVRHEATARALS